MTKRVISIEAGVWWTKVALVDYRKKNPAVYEAFVFQTPEHAIEDGYIRDKDQFASALKDELGKRGIHEKEVIFTLSSSKVVTREVVIPFVKDNKIRGIIDSQIRDYFPMDVSDYTISYSKMGVVEDGDRKKLKLLLVAIPDNLLNNYCTFAERAGLKVETFDYIGNGTVQLMCDGAAENAVVIQLEEQATVISIIENKKMVFQRVTPYGYGATLTSVLEHPVLGAKDEYEAFVFMLNNDVAYGEPAVRKMANEEEMKRQYLLAKEAYEDLSESLSYHLRIANTALEYYQNQVKQTFTGNVYLVGDGARFAGIRQMFGEGISLPLQAFDYSIFADKRKKNSKDAEIEPEGFLSVIGAALRPIDAKPKELQDASSKKNSTQTAYIIFAATVLVSLLLVLASGIRLIVVNLQHNKLQEQIASLSYVQKSYDERNAVQQEEQIYENLDGQTVIKNEQFLPLIRQLEDELPADVRVDGIETSEDMVNINMTADQQISVGQMLLNFQGVTLLQNVSIPSMAQSEDEAGNKIWSYTVSAYYTDAELNNEEETTEGGVELNE